MDLLNYHVKLSSSLLLVLVLLPPSIDNWPLPLFCPYKQQGEQLSIPVAWSAHEGIGRQLQLLKSDQDLLLTCFINGFDQNAYDTLTVLAERWSGGQWQQEDLHVGNERLKTVWDRRDDIGGFLIYVKPVSQFPTLRLRCYYYAYKQKFMSPWLTISDSRQRLEQLRRELRSLRCNRTEYETGSNRQIVHMCKINHTQLIEGARVTAYATTAECSPDSAATAEVSFHSNYTLHGAFYSIQFQGLVSFGWTLENSTDGVGTKMETALTYRDRKLCLLFSLLPDLVTVSSTVNLIGNTTAVDGSVRPQLLGTGATTVELNGTTRWLPCPYLCSSHQRCRPTWYSGVEGAPVSSRQVLSFEDSKRWTHSLQLSEVQAPGSWWCAVAALNISWSIEYRISHRSPDQLCKPLMPKRIVLLPNRNVSITCTACGSAKVQLELVKLNPDASLRFSNRSSDMAVTAWLSTAQSGNYTSLLACHVAGRLVASSAVHQLPLPRQPGDPLCSTNPCQLSPSSETEASCRLLPDYRWALAQLNVSDFYLYRIDHRFTFPSTGRLNLSALKGPDKVEIECWVVLVDMTSSTVHNVELSSLPLSQLHRLLGAKFPDISRRLVAVFSPKTIGSVEILALEDQNSVSKVWLLVALSIIIVVSTIIIIISCHSSCKKSEKQLEPSTKERVIDEFLLQGTASDMTSRHDGKERQRSPAHHRINETPQPNGKFRHFSAKSPNEQKDSSLDKTTPQSSSTMPHSRDGQSQHSDESLSSQYDAGNPGTTAGASQSGQGIRVKRLQYHHLKKPLASFHGTSPMTGAKSRATSPRRNPRATHSPRYATRKMLPKIKAESEQTGLSVRQKLKRKLESLLPLMKPGGYFGHIGNKGLRQHGKVKRMQKTWITTVQGRRPTLKHIWGQQDDTKFHHLPAPGDNQLFIGAQQQEVGKLRNKKSLRDRRSVRRLKNKTKRRRKRRRIHNIDTSSEVEQPRVSKRHQSTVSKQKTEELRLATPSSEEEIRFGSPSEGSAMHQSVESDPEHESSRPTDQPSEELWAVDSIESEFQVAIDIDSDSDRNQQTGDDSGPMVETEDGNDQLSVSATDFRKKTVRFDLQNLQEEEGEQAETAVNYQDRSAEEFNLSEESMRFDREISEGKLHEESNLLKYISDTESPLTSQPADAESDPSEQELEPKSILEHKADAESDPSEQELDQDSLLKTDSVDSYEDDLGYPNCQFELESVTSSLYPDTASISGERWLQQGEEEVIVSLVCRSLEESEAASEAGAFANLSMELSSELIIEEEEEESVTEKTTTDDKELTIFEGSMKAKKLHYNSPLTDKDSMKINQINKQQQLPEVEACEQRAEQRYEPGLEQRADCQRLKSLATMLILQRQRELAKLSAPQACTNDISTTHRPSQLPVARKDTSQLARIGTCRQETQNLTNSTSSIGSNRGLDNDDRYGRLSLNANAAVITEFIFGTLLTPSVANSSSSSGSGDCVPEMAKLHRNLNSNYDLMAWLQSALASNDAVQVQSVVGVMETLLSADAQPSGQGSSSSSSTTKFTFHDSRSLPSLPSSSVIRHTNSHNSYWRLAASGIRWATIENFSPQINHELTCCYGPFHSLCSASRAPKLPTICSSGCQLPCSRQLRTGRSTVRIVQRIKQLDHSLIQQLSIDNPLILLPKIAPLPIAEASLPPKIFTWPSARGHEQNFENNFVQNIIEQVLMKMQ